jgi:hypothetical protein
MDLRIDFPYSSKGLSIILSQDPIHKILSLSDFNSPKNLSRELNLFPIIITSKLIPVNRMNFTMTNKCKLVCKNINQIPGFTNGK